MIRAVIILNKCRNKKLTEISEKDIIDTFVLKKFLESFAVYDNAVSHYVNHINQKRSHRRTRSKNNDIN